MEKTTIACLTLASLLFIFSSANVHAQNTDVKNIDYPKDNSVKNPTANQDIKVLVDFENALLVSADLDKVKSLLDDKFKSYGPGHSDSADREQLVNSWQENYKTQLNRKVNFVEHTWRVPNGDYKGNWVALWGEYDCTINGVDLKIPFQTTAHITNGKIDEMISYWDNMSVYQALGFTLTPPKAGNQ